VRINTALMEQIERLKAKVNSGIKVWVARDGIDTAIYSEKPIYNPIFNVWNPNGDPDSFLQVDGFADINPGECRQYALVEVEEG
jgi:hypothetical protein